LLKYESRLVATVCSRQRASATDIGRNMLH